MFRLLRYFSLTSAVALGVSAAALVLLYRSDQLAEHTTMAETENARMAQSFASTFLPDFAPFLRAASGAPAAELRRRGELNALDIVLRHLAGGLPIVKMKFYSLDGRVIYSSVRAELGGGSDTPAALAAALRGRTASRLSFRSAMAGLDGGVADRAVVATYTPLRDRDGGIAGVFELYSDVTPSLARVNANVLRLSAAIVAVFSGLYLVLLLIVRRADGILRRQHREIVASRAELLNSETKFRSVTESASDAIISITATGRVVSWNLGAERIFGYSAEEMLGRSVEAIVPESNRPAHEAALRRLRQDGAGLLVGRSREVEGLRRNGTLVPVELTLSQWEMDGQDHFTAILRDMSERRLADEAVRKLSLAVEQSPVSIVITDTRGAIEYANPQFCAVTGYSRDEVIGANPRMLKSGQTPPEDYAALWRTVSAGETWHGLLHNRRKDGSLFWEEAIISPIKSPAGRITHFVGIKTDVTERRQQEIDLRQALERLTETNSELERFAYVASHDLQEPLRSITSFAQLLDRRYAGRLDGEADEFIGFIVAAAKRMHALINDLLAYSRVAAQAGPSLPVSAERACRAALDDLHEAIAASGGAVTIAGLPEVLADEVQLVQLFQNLLANAIKFHRPGVPPQVAVSAEARDTSWEITIADNGIGLESTDQDIFEIFRRLHTAEAYPGTGVGLAVCKRIVQRHGGRIWVTSRPGGGTSVHFTLPGVAR